MVCDCSDTYRGGVGKYYLEGKREFLTAPTEWYYEPATREALWIPAAGSEAGPPTGASGRVVDFSLNITNSSFVTLANFSMFATALSVDNEQDSASDPEVAQTFSHHLRFESLELNNNDEPCGDWGPEPASRHDCVGALPGCDLPVTSLLRQGSSSGMLRHAPATDD